MITKRATEIPESRFAVLEFKKTFYFQLFGCLKYQIHHEYEKVLYLKLQNICLFLNF